jgi:hypothetical protein
MYRYKVLVNYKCVDVKSSRYGELVERTQQFLTFSDAMVWIRNVKSTKISNYALLGNPVVEQVG